MSVYSPRGQTNISIWFCGRTKVGITSSIFLSSSSPLRLCFQCWRVVSHSHRSLSEWCKEINLLKCSWQQPNGKWHKIIRAIIYLISVTHNGDLLPLYQSNIYVSSRCNQDRWHLHSSEGQNILSPLFITTVIAILFQPHIFINGILCCLDSALPCADVQ